MKQTESGCDNKQHCVEKTSRKEIDLSDRLHVSE